MPWSVAMVMSERDAFALAEVVPRFFALAEVVPRSFVCVIFWCAVLVVAVASACESRVQHDQCHVHCPAPAVSA